MSVRGRLKIIFFIKVETYIYLLFLVDNFFIINKYNLSICI